MVGMDGISATRAITGRAPEVNVVLLTSSQDAELGMIGLRAGADGHLVKGLPFCGPGGRGPLSGRRRARAGSGRRAAPHRAPARAARRRPRRASRTQHADLARVGGARSPVRGAVVDDVADRLVLARDTVRRTSSASCASSGCTPRPRAIELAKPDPRDLRARSSRLTRRPSSVFSARGRVSARACAGVGLAVDAYAHSRRHWSSPGRAPPHESALGGRASGRCPKPLVPGGQPDADPLPSSRRPSSSRGPGWPPLAVEPESAAADSARGRRTVEDWVPADRATPSSSAALGIDEALWMAWRTFVRRRARVLVPSAVVCASAASASVPTSRTSPRERHRRLGAAAARPGSGRRRGRSANGGWLLSERAAKSPPHSAASQVDRRLSPTCCCEQGGDRALPRPSMAGPAVPRRPGRTAVRPIGRMLEGRSCPTSAPACLDRFR
jgi:hypothetical protein